MIKRLQLCCWMWTCSHLQLAADLQTRRDQSRARKTAFFKDILLSLTGRVKGRIVGSLLSSRFRSGLSLRTVTRPLIADYRRLFVLWPVAERKISHRSWRMPGNSLSGIQHGAGIFGKSNFISTNMRKMKTNTTQTANYHPLGPLSLDFSLKETHKSAQNGRLQCR